jgi:hypothetical protein
VVRLFHHFGLQITANLFHWHWVNIHFLVNHHLIYINTIIYLFRLTVKNTTNWSHIENSPPGTHLQFEALPLLGFTSHARFFGFARFLLIRSLPIEKWRWMAYIRWKSVKLWSVIENLWFPLVHRPGNFKLQGGRVLSTLNRKQNIAFNVHQSNYSFNLTIKDTLMISNNPLNIHFINLVPNYANNAFLFREWTKVSI